MLAWAVFHRKYKFQFDVQGAFLLSFLKHKMWMRLPKEIAAMLGMTVDQVWELKKTLYGLRQAAAAWHFDFTKEMKRLGFKTFFHDDCLFRRVDKRGDITVAIHVDDGIGAASSKQLAQEFLKAFKYPISDSGPLKYCLGMRVCDDFKAGTMTLDAQADIHTAAKFFGCDKTRKHDTPMEARIKLSRDQCPTKPEDIAEMKSIPFRGGIGTAQYFVNIRPDCQYPTSKLASFTSNPSMEHWKCCQRMLKYMDHSKKKLHFGTNRKTVKVHSAVRVFVDADLAGCLDTDRSRTGIIYTMFGDVVETMSKLQKSTVNSSCHGETKAIATAVRKLEFFRDLCKFLGDTQYYATGVFSDSAAAIALINGDRVKHNMTHMRCDWRIIKEKIGDNDVFLVHIPGVENPADLLTKALPGPAHKLHTSFILNEVPNPYKWARRPLRLPVRGKYRKLLPIIRKLPRQPVHIQVVGKRPNIGRIIDKWSTRSMVIPSRGMPQWQQMHRGATVSAQAG
jgi:hypothetical protein